MVAKAYEASLRHRPSVSKSEQVRVVSVNGRSSPRKPEDSRVPMGLTVFFPRHGYWQNSENWV